MYKRIMFLSIIVFFFLIVIIFVKSKLFIIKTANIEVENVSSYIINSILINQNLMKEGSNMQSKDIFTSSEIPNSILKKMIGNSISDKNKVDINGLSYLKITYFGFDEKIHTGEMIVNKDVAQEVLDIFQEVYYNKYPIEKIELIDKYNANDEKSMEDNNTSAFCYRTITNTNKLSIHSLGKAIDVNPLYNPCVVNNFVFPAKGKLYANRSIVRKGTIQKGDVLYNAFLKRGWNWGGNWKTKKDYQHFEKI